MRPCCSRNNSEKSPKQQVIILPGDSVEYQLAYHGAMGSAVLIPR